MRNLVDTLNVRMDVTAKMVKGLVEIQVSGNIDNQVDRIVRLAEGTARVVGIDYGVGIVTLMAA
jgi:hypothetical protein